MNIILIIFCVILLILKFCSKYIKNRFYYFPINNPYYDKPNPNIKDIYITNKQNHKLHAWYYTNNPTKSTILFCHGNAGNLSYRNHIMTNLINMGYNVLLFDYQGFGKSEGKTFVESTYEDAEDWLNYLIKTEKISESKIVPMGESIGSFPATKLAQIYNLPKLILLSGFHCIADVINELIPAPFGYILSVIAGNDLNVGYWLQKYNNNPLILHSQTDEIISYKNAIKNSEYGGTLIKIGGGHNNPVINWQDIENYLN